MNARPENHLFHALKEMAEPKPFKSITPPRYYTVGLGAWDAATPEQREATRAFCKQEGMLLAINADDLGELNDRDTHGERGFDEKREAYERAQDYETGFNR